MQNGKTVAATECHLVVTPRLLQNTIGAFHTSAIHDADADAGADADAHDDDCNDDNFGPNCIYCEN